MSAENEKCMMKNSQEAVNIRFISFQAAKDPIIFSFIIYIAFVNSERRLAKSRVDITLCQHEKFPATLLLKFFVLYYN